MCPIQRIYEVNERMAEYLVDMREPLVINSSELDEVAKYLYDAISYKAPNSNIEFLKSSIRGKRAKLWGRTIIVLL